MTDIVRAPTTITACDECGGTLAPMVLIGFGSIFIEETGEGAMVMCLDCLDEARRILLEVK